MDDKSYKSVEEMLQKTAFDEESKQFAEDFSRRVNTWHYRLRMWFRVNWQLLKIKIRKLRYPESAVPKGNYCYGHRVHRELGYNSIISMKQQFVCPYWELRE